MLKRTELEYKGFLDRSRFTPKVVTCNPLLGRSTINNNCKFGGRGRFLHQGVGAKVMLARLLQCTFCMDTACKKACTFHNFHAAHESDFRNLRLKMRGLRQDLLKKFFLWLYWQFGREPTFSVCVTCPPSYPRASLLDELHLASIRYQFQP